MSEDKHVLNEIFMGDWCACPKCGSRNVWVKDDYSSIRCGACGFSEKSKVVGA